jgi:MYXO-CTERM domain-containing protein
MFTATGSLAVGRRGHVAVLLTSGKVLVAAGTDGSMGLTSAELYDPADGRFSPTGSLLVGRGVNGGRIQAVLLASGEVLVPGAPPDPSEIYSPTTGTWRAAASMNEARIGYAAALLPSGRVLVAGGSGSPAALRSGEIYDPAANRWSSAGMMAADRALPASAVLTGGAVLVTGGGVGEKSAEIYEEEPPPPPDQGPDAGPSDAAADVRADMSADSTSADGPGAGGADSARDGADANRTDAGSGSGDSGCGCRMGGARSEREAAAGWLLAVALLGMRCRRRRPG